MKLTIMGYASIEVDGAHSKSLTLPMLYGPLHARAVSVQVCLRRTNRLAYKMPASSLYGVQTCGRCLYWAKFCSSQCLTNLQIRRADCQAFRTSHTIWNQALSTTMYGTLPP